MHYFFFQILYNEKFHKPHSKNCIHRLSAVNPRTYPPATKSALVAKAKKINNLASKNIFINQNLLTLSALSLLPPFCLFIFSILPTEQEACVLRVMRPQYLLTSPVVASITLIAQIFSFVMTTNCWLTQIRKKVLRSLPRNNLSSLTQRYVRPRT